MSVYFCESDGVILDGDVSKRIYYGKIGYAYEIHPYQEDDERGQINGYEYFIFFGNEAVPYTESSEWYESISEAVKAAETHITSRCEDGER